MTRRKTNTSRRSRKVNKNSKDRNSSPKNQIRVVKDRRSMDRSAKARLRKRRERQRIYRRRRIALLACLLIVIFLPSYLIYKKVNSYKFLDYPTFRDEVLDDISKEAFVTSTEGRSLTSAEKSSDFDKILEYIVKNYAVDKNNRQSYEDFIKQGETYKKKIANSKTDQEFFTILGNYLSLLNDPASKILDKDTYDDLFDYYKNKGQSHIKTSLENPQVVNRYKRIINDKTTSKANITIESASTLRISLSVFKLSELDTIIDEMTKAVTSTPSITRIILDLEENSSINYLFVNEFAKYLIHQDYNFEDIFYYRGSLLGNNLEDIKNSNESDYQTPYIKNQASKTNEKPSSFNLSDYSYYDKVTLKIKKDSTFANRGIYILVNSNTANEAIRLASILKDSGAYVVKNALDPNPNMNDRIYNMMPSLLVLDHSGLIVSITTAREKGENKYIEYNQRINSKNPIGSILSIAG